MVQMGLDVIQMGVQMGLDGGPDGGADGVQIGVQMGSRWGSRRGPVGGGGPRFVQTTFLVVYKLH